MSGRFGTASYVHPADIPQQRAKTLEAEQREMTKRQHQNLAERSARQQRMIGGMYKTETQCRVDAQVRTNCTNAGIVNEGAIKAEQEKARATLAAGGKILPPPNLFREAKTRYGTEPAKHVLERQLREGKL